MRKVSFSLPSNLPSRLVKTKKLHRKSVKKFGRNILKKIICCVVFFHFRIVLPIKLNVQSCTFKLFSAHGLKPK